MISSPITKQILAKTITFSVFAMVILITNTSIYILDYLEYKPNLIGLVGIYLNFMFFLIAIFLFFYGKKINLDVAEKVSEIHQPIDTPYSDQWLIDNISQILCIKDGQGRWLLASKSYLRLFHIEADSYQGKTDKQLSSQSPNFKQILLSSYQQDKSAWEKRESVTVIAELPGKNDEKVYMKVTKTPIFDIQGKPYKLITSGSNVSPGEQKQSRLQLAASVFEQSIQSMLILDLNFKIMHINTPLSVLLGFSARQMKNKNLSFLNEQDIDEMFMQSIHKQIESQLFWEGKLYCSRKNSAPLLVKLNIAPVVSRSKGTIKHYIGVLSETSAQKSVENDIEQILFHEGLMRFSSHSIFIDRLNSLLANAQKQSTHTVLLIIELDKFMDIYKSIPSFVCAKFLKEVTNRITQTTRHNDVIGQIDDHKFIVILENIISFDAAYNTSGIVAEKLLNATSKPINIQSKDVILNASIGIAIYPEDANNGQNLFKQADNAMFAVIENGCNAYQFSQTKLVVKKQNDKQLGIDLATALQRLEFKLFYQPQFDIQNQNVIGNEALLRWFKNYKTQVLPNDFIAVTEQNGLIIPLGEWVLETACQQQKTWLEAGYSVDRVTVNISGHQLYNEDFTIKLEKILSKTNLDPKHLMLEFTDSLLMEDIEAFTFQIHRLKTMGIGIAIDNFGENLTALPGLVDLPIDLIKIDQSLINNITNEIDDSDIVSYIIETAHSFKYKVMAQGVENTEQFDLLKYHNCDYIQGFLLGKPDEAEKISLLLKTDMKE